MEAVRERALRLALAKLRDPEPRERILAIEDLSDYTDIAIMDRLIDLAQNDPHLKVRCAAILGLGEFTCLASYSLYEPETDQEVWDLDDDLSAEDFDRVYGFLLDVYRDEQRSLDERRYAVEVISHFSSDTVEDLIAELYARPEKQAQISALCAMGNNGSRCWGEPLRSAVYHPDADLQLEAIFAVGRMGLSSLGKDLYRLTYSENRDVMLTAIWALGQSGWDGAFDRLDELTLHWEPEIREAADEAMDEWLLFNSLASEAGVAEGEEFPEEE
jgi:HEAT repeat protein